MYIGQLHLVTDLEDGDRAYPEANVSYEIESIDDSSLNTTVAYVERRGNRLIARGYNGRDYAVSGIDGYELYAVRKPPQR